MEDLSRISPQARERWTKVDIVFEKVVTHDAEIKTCPGCSTQTKGPFPTDMQGPVQYGLGIKAYALNFLIAQMVPLNRIQRCSKH